MKTSTIKLSSLFLTIGLLLISFNSNSQDIKLTRQEKKEARATITGLTRGKLVFDGRVESIYNSNVYKGRNSI